MCGRVGWRGMFVYVLSSSVVVIHEIASFCLCLIE